MPATIVDSNVVMDLLEPGSAWSGWARKQISEARLSGELVFNVVIAAEVAHKFLSAASYDAVFTSSLWTFEHVPREAALIAGWAHREYRARGGQRAQTLPDFLIGAHAVVSSHVLLTRDAKRYRTYFPDAKLVAPDTHS